MLQQQSAEDYVIATGGKRIRSRVSCRGVWGFEHGLGKVRFHRPRYFRPAEVDLLLGDPGKAKRQLNWNRKSGLSSWPKMRPIPIWALARRERLLVVGTFVRGVKNCNCNLKICKLQIRERRFAGAICSLKIVNLQFAINVLKLFNL